MDRVKLEISARVSRVDINRLIRYPRQDRDKLPEVPGIYIVGYYQQKEIRVLYVGQTTNFRHRHKSHHREHTFREEEKSNKELFIWCWPLSSDLMKTRMERKINLLHAEDCFRVRFKPEINDTPVPGAKTVARKNVVRYWFNGNVYVAVNFLPKYSADLDSTSLPAFHTTAKKLHHVQRAVQQKSPCFLISSLPIKSINLPEMANYKRLLSPDPYWRRETSLYFLEYMFRARGYERTSEIDDFDLCIYGDTSTSVVRRIYLNDLDGFREFRQSYLTMGMTNCSNHDFTDRLLSLVRVSTPVN